MLQGQTGTKVLAFLKHKQGLRN